MNEIFILVVKIVATVALSVNIFLELIVVSVSDLLKGQEPGGGKITALIMAFIIFAIWI